MSKGLALARTPFPAIWAGGRLGTRGFARCRVNHVTGETRKTTQALDLCGTANNSQAPCPR